MVVEVCGEVGAVVFGTVDEAGPAPPEDVGAEQVHAGGVADDPSVVADASLVVEDGHVDPGVLRVVPRGPDDGPDVATAEVELEDRTRWHRCRLGTSRPFHVVQTSFLPWPEALLAEVQLQRGDLAAATEMSEHAFTMGRKLSGPCWESMGARGRGLVAIRSGDLDRGIALLAQTPVMCRRLPDSYLWIEAYGLEAMCDVAVENGLPSASRWIAELERLATRGGFKELASLALYHRARRHEPGAAEAASATADGIDNDALKRRVADVDRLTSAR